MDPAKIFELTANESAKGGTCSASCRQTAANSQRKGTSVSKSGHSGQIVDMSNSGDTGGAGVDYVETVQQQADTGERHAKWSIMTSRTQSPAPRDFM